jgi:tetratricopeptide (TPR) repeat protein
MLRTLACALVAGSLLVPAAPPTPALAQFPPDSFTNLKVLPRDIATRDLVGLMVSFTRALGVRCSTCHVGEEGQPLASYDFPADEKLLKRKARVMLRMVEKINSEILTELEERVEPSVRVECATCHRGARVPRMIQDILLAAYEDGGIESTFAVYDSLRDEYYGTFTYDFSEVVLSDVGVKLQQDGQLADAVRLYQRNAALFPESLLTQRQHASNALLLKFQTEGVEAGTALYRDLKARYAAEAFPELLLNRLGYALLRGEHVEEAIAVFQLNVEAYPQAYNVYDSLGEAYMVAGEREKAISNYERSLELNPQNTNAVEKLEELRRRN